MSGKHATPPGQPGQPDAVEQTRSRIPHGGVAAGGLNPYPVISTVSQRKSCNWPRVATPPSAR
jgi:hypothetical protein